jgi:hypothetical protein
MVLSKPEIKRYYLKTRTIKVKGFGPKSKKIDTGSREQCLLGNLECELFPFLSYLLC